MIWIYEFQTFYLYFYKVFLELPLISEFLCKEMKKKKNTSKFW